MVVREPFDWSAVFGGASWWAMAILVLTALALVIVRLRADRSREGRE